MAKEWGEPGSTEFKLKKSLYDKEYRAKNHKKIDARRAEWVKKNKEKSRSYKYKYALTHREEHRLANKKRIDSRRKHWFLKNGPCVKCGSKKKLELDHINPKHKIAHNVWSWKEEDRLKELDKCQVLCWKCHRIKTIKDNGWQLKDTALIEHLSRISFFKLTLIGKPGLEQAIRLYNRSRLEDSIEEY